MLSKHPMSGNQSNATWILVANRAGAHLLESDGGLKNLRSKDYIDFPEGRLKNREIDTDRSSGAASTAGGAYPVHGMVNKGEAHFHMTQVFARQLAELLSKGRTENHYQRLVLVAEDRFLGEIMASLDHQTKTKVMSAIHKDIAGLSAPEVLSQLRELRPLQMTG